MVDELISPYSFSFTDTVGKLPLPLPPPRTPSGGPIHYMGWPKRRAGKEIFWSIRQHVVLSNTPNHFLQTRQPRGKENYGGYDITKYDQNLQTFGLRSKKSITAGKYD